MSRELNRSFGSHTGLSERPSVLKYLDFRQFLADYYTFRKRQKASFSYQSWADELGFKDRSFLRMIITGRRGLSDSNKVLFIEKMDFDDLEALYFSHLVSHNNSEEGDTKKAHQTKMMALIKLQLERTYLEAPQKQLFAHPKVLALYILIGYEDLNREPNTLAEKLKEPVETISAWLHFLEGQSMIEWDDQRRQWNSKSKSFKIPDSPGNAIIKDFHRQNLQHAVDCLSLGGDQRKFRSLILTLNSEQMEKVWKKYNDFVLDVISDLEGQKLCDRQLFHVNFNLVPTNIGPELLDEDRPEKRSMPR